MRLFFKGLGRALQLVALLVLPSAVWAAQLGRSEAGSIAIFLGSTAVFFLGYSINRMGSRL